MNISLNIALLAFIFTLSPFLSNSQRFGETDCSQFYNEMQYNDLKFDGKLKSKSNDNQFYKFEIIEADQSTVTLKLFKNHLTREIFHNVAVNDLFIKNRGEKILRVGYFVGQNLDVKLYNGLCE